MSSGLSGPALQAKGVSAARLEQSLHWNLEARGQEGRLFPGVEGSTRELHAGSLWSHSGCGSGAQEEVALVKLGRQQGRPTCGSERCSQVGRTGAPLHGLPAGDPPKE